MKKSKVKKKILFIHYSFSSFIKNDLEILKKHFDVKKVKWRGKRDILKIAINSIKSDITFTWFAGDYAAVAVFFSRLFRKKSIIIVGGGDVACVPELNYGQFNLNWYKRALTKYALKNADFVLPVSKFTKEEILKIVKPKNLFLVYNGVDTDKFKPLGIKENDLVITVGGIGWSNLKRKGIETFVKSAKFIPKARFVVIGKFADDSIDHLKSIAMPNVEFTGFVSDNELIGWYRKAKVVCQLSYYEAFGLSPAEAMACNCIPVVTKVRTGLPEFVNDAGFYCPYGDEKATAEIIKKALESPSDLGKKARQKITNKFTINIREKLLLKILTELE